MSASDAWTSTRITSSTSIQQVVSKALTHLSDPSRGPFVIHTFPAGERQPKDSSNRDDADASTGSHKARHAAVGKLISVVEIVKREFVRLQRDQLREDDGAKSIGKSTGKGKARAVDDDDHDDISNKENHDGHPHQAPHVSTVQQGRTPSRPKLLKIVQYNELTAFEALPDQDVISRGASSDAPANTAAFQQLDAAIRDHVVRGHKRPRKKHTPCMRVTLFSERVPALEEEMHHAGNGWTVQITDPPKPARAHKRKRKRDGSAPAKDSVQAAADGAQAMQENTAAEAAELSTRSDELEA